MIAYYKPMMAYYAVKGTLKYAIIGTHQILPKIDYTFYQQHHNLKRNPVINAPHIQISIAKLRVLNFKY